MIRIDRITTRTGDGGTTGLSDGSRLPKHHALIAAIGAVDEANTSVGIALAEGVPDAIADELRRVQNDLFDLGGDLATPPGGPYEAKIMRIVPAQVARLEQAVAESSGRLAPLTSFVLPGGSRAAARLHGVRTSVRAAERAVCAAIAAVPERTFNPHIAAYLNRLSDAAFAWARLANDGGKADIAWVPGANRC